MDNANESKAFEEADKTAGQAPQRKKKKEKQPPAPDSFRGKLYARWEKFKQSKFGLALQRHFAKYGYLYCSFIMPSALFMMIFIVQGTYPINNSSVLVLDLNGQYVYFFEALRKAIYGDASLLYSWCGSLGSEFLGVYAYYLASPLSYLVALFPETAMTEAIMVIELIKCGLCGLTMALYLKKTRPRANEMITIAIATMYALCAFGVVMAHNTMWIDALIWLPMITLGIESLINRGRFILLTASLAMSLLSNFYIGYMTCIYVFVYFFYYYFFASHRASTACVEVKAPGDNNFYGERFHFIKTFARMGGAAVIAVLLAAVIILPTAYSLSLGKSEFSTTDWSFVLFRTDASKNLFFKITPLDFITKMFIASYDTVRRDLVYNGISYPGLPFLYCGMLALLLVPAYFLSKRVNRRQKVGAGLILGFFFLSMLISPIDIIWHGFQNPNWLNFRYAFMFSFLMLVFSHRALELWHTVKFKKTVITAAVWGALVLLCAFFTPKMFDRSYARREALFILLPLAFLGVYVLMHFFLLRVRKNAVARASVLATLAVVICVEMFIGALLNSTSLGEDVTFSPKYTRKDGSWLEGYDNFLDKLRPTVNRIQETDNSFYRMEKGDGYLLSDPVRVFRKYDDNYALNMRGVTGSTSTLNARTIKFLQRIGYVSTSNISRYKGGSAVTDSLLGMKYLIYSMDMPQKDFYLNAWPDADSYVVDCQDSKNTFLYTYLNEYALSLAYAADAQIKDYNITDSPSPLVTVNNLISALLGKEVEVYKNMPSTFLCETGVTHSASAYSETLFDKYGEEIPAKDKDGNPLYSSEYEYPLLSVRIYNQSDFEAIVRAEREKNPDATYEKSIAAEAKERYDAYLETIEKYKNDQAVTRSEKTSTPYHTFNFSPKKNEDGSFVKDDQGNILYPSVTFTFTTPDTLPENSEIFFSIPTKYSRECYWTFTSDKEGAASTSGTYYSTDDRSDCLQIMALMGPGETGTVTITFKSTDGAEKSLYIDRTEGCGMFWYIDETAFADAMNSLKEGNFNIQQYNESHFIGTINAPEGKTSVFTTIPYEEYWEVLVDGQPVETYMTCAALVGFDLPSAGEHTIEIEYRSQPLFKGMILCGIGALLFAGWITVDFVFLRKKRASLPALDYDCYSEGDYQSDEYDEEIIEKKDKKDKKSKKNKNRK